jgi:integrase
MMAATGIRQRHGLRCNGKARCDCPWQASVYSQRDGKKIRQAFPTRAAAKAWREDKLGAVKRGELRVPTSTTVREAAAAFIDGARDGSIPTRTGRRYKPATVRGYDEALNLRVLPALGARRLSDVDSGDVQDLADRLTGEGLSASTVHNTLDPLRVIYRRAIRRKLVTVDPTKGLELRRPDGRRERIADPGEARTLIAALPASERTMWACAFYAGLRRGELRALRWSDVDVPGRVIRVQRGWDAKEGEQDGKSAAAKHRVPILDPLARELAAHKLRTRRDGDALVFGRTAAEAFIPSTVRSRALKAWKAAKLKPIALHEARHTCASLMIAAGVNAKALSVIMGHATISITFDTYGHLMPDGLDAAAQAMNTYLAGLDGERPALRVVA